MKGKFRDREKVTNKTDGQREWEMKGKTDRQTGR
jgi:hypothetical protein